METRELNLNKKIAKVVLYDFSNYVGGLASNGGHYGFWEKYLLEPNGLYKLSYHTTADFDYCLRCGNWGKHPCEYKYISEKELKEIINSYYKICNEKGYSLKIEYEDGKVFETKGVPY